MTIFAIIVHQGADVLQQEIEQRYSDKYYLPPSCWFVVDEGTSEEVGIKLRLKDGQLVGVQAVIIPVSNYYGFAPSGLWEWIKSRRAKT